MSVGAYEHVGTPPVEPHVPGDANVRSVLAVQVAGGGVVHEVSVHGSAHRPVPGSQDWLVAVQSVDVAVYSQTGEPLDPLQVPVAANETDVVGVVASQCGGGGVVHDTPVHTFVQSPVAPSHVWLLSAQSTVVGV